jgi:hypothetical protein
MDEVDVVPGCIQLYKRNYSHVPQGCLVQGGKEVVGNVQILQFAVETEIYFKMHSVLVKISIITVEVLMCVCYFCTLFSGVTQQE